MCEGCAVPVSGVQRQAGAADRTPGSRLAHLVYVTFFGVMLPDRALRHLPVPPSPMPQDGRCRRDSKHGCVYKANINAVLVSPSW